MIYWLATYINSVFQLKMSFLQEWLLYTQLLEMDINYFPENPPPEEYFFGGERFTTTPGSGQGCPIFET